MSHFLDAGSHLHAGARAPHRWLREARRRALLDITTQDPFGFTPFEKTTPDDQELWLSHKLADALSAWLVVPEPRLLETIPLSTMARPNHVE